MSLTSALSAANSGLRANSFQSDLLARNIANASTEGYTRKAAQLVTQNGSVHVTAVAREVDNLLDRLDRSNLSSQARTETVASGLRSYTNMLGQPEDETSPAAGIAGLYTSIVTLSGTPNSNAAQLGVIETAKVLASQITTLAQTAVDLAQEVEINIRYDVSDLNDNLIRIGQINARLLQSGGTGIEGAELKDEMGRLLDSVAGLMDIQILGNADGSVNIYTAGGTELVQGRQATTVTYQQGTGQLYAGDINITPGRNDTRAFTGGSLAGLFELKNIAIPEIKEGLDEYATLLIERFASVDPTLTPPQKGLFVDSAVVAGTAATGGTATRLQVNPDLDPSQGGRPDKMISGLGTATTIAAGSNVIAKGMLDILDARPADNTRFGTQISLTDFSTNLVVAQQKQRVTAESQSEAARISGATISASRQNLQGVNVDDELQKLLVIEQSYAANAKVLTSVQFMLDTLLDAV